MHLARNERPSFQNWKTQNEPNFWFVKIWDKTFTTLPVNCNYGGKH